MTKSRHDLYGRSPVQKTMQSIYEILNGFPYSPHRSKRIEKKLRKRHAPKLKFNLSTRIPSQEQLKEWHNPWYFHQRTDDAADALSYALKGLRNHD